MLCASTFWIARLTAAGKFCKPSLSVASLLPSLDNSQLPVFDLRCSLLAHYCGQLICQNFVLALSRRSSNIQEEVPAHASMAVTSSCTFSSLSAQKKSDGKLTLPSLFLKKYEGEKMFSLLHHNTTYFVIC